MSAIVVVAWAIVGLFIATPYTFAASGSLHNFLMTCLFGPPIALLLFVVWLMENQRLSDADRKRHWLSSCYFWTFMAYSCLPIILNGLSVAVQAAGYQTAADYIFALRYLSLIALLLITGVGFFIFVACMLAYQQVRRRISGSTPPASV